MLAHFEIAEPTVDTDRDRRRAVCVAFGSWDLPLHVFQAAFYRALPAWDAQKPVEQRVVLLLDQLDHEPWPEQWRRVERVLRETVRTAFPPTRPLEP